MSIHFAAGSRYAANNRKRAPPSRDAAKQLAREIRLTEYNNACDVLNQMGSLPTNLIGCELFSLFHDVCAGNHDRDYRGPYLFVSDLLRDSGRALRSPDVISCQYEPASLQVNVFAAHGQMRDDYIDLLAYGEIRIGFNRQKRPRGQIGRSGECAFRSISVSFLLHTGKTCCQITPKWNAPSICQV